MASFKYVIVCFGIIAASLRSGNALSDEERNKIQAALLAPITECGAEYGTDKDTVMEAKEKGNVDGIDPCFLACVFKKGGVMNEDGLFDPEATLEEVKKYISKEEDINTAKEIGAECAKVNDESVLDAEKGCERAKLLFTCFQGFKGKFL